MTMRRAAALCALTCAFSLMFALSAHAAVTTGTTLSMPPNFQGLVGWWTFDGKDMVSNVNDASGQGNTGTLSGFTSTTTVPGPIGQALNFNGNDYVNIANSSSLSVGSTATFAMWVEPDPSWPSYAVFLDKADGAGTDYRIQRYYVSNQLEFFDNVNSLIGGTLTLGAWNFVVVTVNNGTATGYINGVQAFSGAVNNPLNTSGGLLNIGRYSGGTNFIGGIDDVRIYNRAISAAEVLQL